MAEAVVTSSDTGFSMFQVEVSGRDKKLFSSIGQAWVWVAIMEGCCPVSKPVPLLREVSGKDPSTSLEQWRQGHSLLKTGSEWGLQRQPHTAYNASISICPSTKHM